MALYKYQAYLGTSDSEKFDDILTPGTTTPYSAIYRCMGCHREVVSEEGRPLPPQNHHTHTPNQGAIRWRMVVYADHKPK